MKKKLEPIYTICMPLLLSALLVGGWCYKLRHGGVTAYIPLIFYLATCLAAFVYVKKMNPLTIYRCLAFCFAFSCQIPQSWVDACFAGTLPEIDLLSSLISEVYIILKYVLVLAVLLLAAAKLETATNSRNRFCLILAATMFLAGILFPDLLYITCSLSGAFLFLVCAELWTKLIDKTEYGICWDIFFFGLMYVKALSTLVL